MSSFHREETEKQPQLPTLPHATLGWPKTHRAQRGLVHLTGHQDFWAQRELDHTQPICPPTANQSSLERPRGGSAPARTSVDKHPVHPPSPTHSEPDESSSTVPALILMAMGMTPFSCSWRLCRGGGRGGGPPRLPSLAEEPREDPVPCSRGSRRRLLFSLMVGRYFLRMPGGQRAGAVRCQWRGQGYTREPQQLPAG